MQRVTKKPRRNFNHQYKGKFNKFNKKRREPTFDQMMRKFKKDTEKSGIIKECKKREFYEKPAAKRRRKKNEASRRVAKQLRKEQEILFRGRNPFSR